MKKIFVISSIILTAVLIFGGVYVFVFQEKDSLSNEEDSIIPKDQKVDDSEEADVAKEKINIISDEAVLAPTLNADGNSIFYYSATNGNTMEIALDGEGKQVRSRDVLSGIADVYWAPQKNKVISRLLGEESDKFYYYDLGSRNSVRLKDGLDSVSWSNLGDKIIYKYYDSATGKRSLNIADPDGNNWKMLAETPFRYLDIAPVPQSSLVSFWNHPDAFSETDFQSISFVGGAAKLLFSGKFGADYLWAPDGQHFLVSYTDSQGGHLTNLYVSDKEGKNVRNLGIPTFASKVVWSKNGETIFYALPGAISLDAVLPNDYESKKVTTRDTFWKTDINTGEKTRLVELAEIKEVYDASRLFLSSDEEMLFFVNRLNGKLYRLDINSR